MGEASRRSQRKAEEKIRRAVFLGRRVVLVLGVRQLIVRRLVRGVQLSFETFPLRLMCSWALVAELNERNQEKWRTICEEPSWPSSFCIRASKGQNCLSSRGCTYFVDKKWRISLELYQWRDAWPEVCVVELLRRWVSRSVNR